MSKQRPGFWHFAKNRGAAFMAFCVFAQMTKSAACQLRILQQKRGEENEKDSYQIDSLDMAIVYPEDMKKKSG